MLILLTILLLAVSFKVTWAVLRFCGRLLGILLSVGAFAVVGILAVVVFCLTKLFVPIVVVVAVVAILTGLKRKRA